MDNLGGFGDGMDMNIGLEDNTFTWEMVGLGLEEPLPPQDTIDELYVNSGRFLNCRLTQIIDIRFTSTRLILQFP